MLQSCILFFRGILQSCILLTFSYDNSFSDYISIVDLLLFTNCRAIKMLYQISEPTIGVGQLKA
uniref:Uncharacterized protein n=1 Tax=Setaria viridis TaxID=4556 RepID=A0A4U6VNG7_SETVI|nr:hypothetical protein SEVIR_2G095850v2 [Setaria viridis]